MAYILTSLDGSITHDAESLLGPGCHRKLIEGCTYSAARFEELAHRKLPELAGSGRWRFMAGEEEHAG